MRIWALLLLLVGLAIPASAAERVTIEQFEQILAGVWGRSDGDVAWRIKNLELTERASRVRRARWQAEFPGRHCHEALTVLADASAFLDLPAADMPADPPPSLDARRQMLSKTIAYVTTTTTRLPNFYATRATESFKDSPRRPWGIGKVTTYAPLHLVGTSKVIVSYRDGRELRNSKPVVDLRKVAPSANGISTTGEFGPILRIVLGDAVRGRLMWAYWEQGATGREAVFRYSVLQVKSNFTVYIPHGGRLDQIHPAYHGEIAIDPASGSILRISEIADLAPPYQSFVSSIQVEYAPVTLGAAEYICPVKSIALFKMPVGGSNPGPHSGASPSETDLNDVVFTDYHLFRSEARVITSGAVGEQAPLGSSSPGK
jgi:hypothetical protein